MIEFRVYGVPGPQGSKRHVGGGRMIESSAKVKPWREAVKWAAREAMKADPWAGQIWAVFPQFPLDGPLRVRMVFTLPKPASAPKTRQTWPDRKPDVSKLARSTEDALTDAGFWRDDARAVEYALLAKRYPNEGEYALDAPGAWIQVEVMR